MSRPRHLVDFDIDTVRIITKITKGGVRSTIYQIEGLDWEKKKTRLDLPYFKISDEDLCKLIAFDSSVYNWILNPTSLVTKYYKMLYKL